MDLPWLDIAADWSFWDRPVPPSVSRRVDAPATLRPGLAVVVQGVRRCGKSTWMRQMMARYGLDPRRCLFLNFEDPRLVQNLRASALDQLVAAFRAARPEPAPRVFFLDEIQEVKGWERWIRTQVDRPGEDVFVVSGSNATLLAGELGSALTGRHLTVEMFPFDLGERRALHPETSLEQHLYDGGFPEPLQTPDGDRLLRQYLIDIVDRDVRERVAARSSRPLRQLVHLAYESAGSELSQRRASAALGLSADTVGVYLDACEAAYLLFQVPFFAFSERQRAHRNRKLYPIDTGLRRCVVNPTTYDRGKSLECATFLALRRRFSDIAYWRGEGGEVDFVLRKGATIVPVQVSWDGPQDRHHRALQNFYEHFPFAAEAWWVTAETFGELDRREIG
jgi:hypothetical protein